MEKQFPIVCIGGSAGGLEAYIKILKLIPLNLGITIVIVNHITIQTTILHKILRPHTPMPVSMITHSLRIRPNHVFVVPNDCDLTISNGHFRLRPRSKPSGWSNVITLFLFSLARFWDGLLIVVIVSGLDGDGAEALGEIKKAGGIVMVQTPDSAGWSDMPESAIRTGTVDYILPVESIAMNIIKIVSERMSNAPPRVI